MAEMRVLLTCFEPFGDRPLNSSGVVVERLQRQASGVDLHMATLPVSFARAWPTLRTGAEEVRPDAVVLLGQAARRTRIEVEQVAVNVADTTTPDNDGARPTGEPVLGDGPAAHLSTVSVHRAVEQIRAAGAPAGVSRSAGSYVCNHVYYLALHHLGPRPVVFVHLPLLPEQSLADGEPTMSADLMEAGVAAVIEVVVDAAGQGARR